MKLEQVLEGTGQEILNRQQLANVLGIPVLETFNLQKLESFPKSSVGAFGVDLWQRKDIDAWGELHLQELEPIWEKSKVPMIEAEVIDEPEETIGFTTLCELMGKSVIKVMGIIATASDFPKAVGDDKSLTYRRSEIEQWIKSHPQTDEQDQVATPDAEIVPQSEQKSSASDVVEEPKFTMAEANEMIESFIEKRLAEIVNRSYLTARDCCFMLNMSRTLLASWIKKHDFPKGQTVFINGVPHVHYPKKKVLLWIKRREQAKKALSTNQLKTDDWLKDRDQKIASLNDREYWDSIDIFFALGISPDLLRRYNSLPGFPANRPLPGAKNRVMYKRTEIQQWFSAHGTGLMVARDYLK